MWMHEYLINDSCKTFLCACAGQHWFCLRIYLHTLKGYIHVDLYIYIHIYLYMYIFIQPDRFAINEQEINFLDLIAKIIVSSISFYYSLDRGITDETTGMFISEFARSIVCSILKIIAQFSMHSKIRKTDDWCSKLGELRVIISIHIVVLVRNLLGFWVQRAQQCCCLWAPGFPWLFFVTVAEFGGLARAVTEG